MEQTEPPTVGLSKLFPDGNYPEGELQDYKDEYVHTVTLQPHSMSYLSSAPIAMRIGRRPRRSATTSAWRWRTPR